MLIKVFALGVIGVMLTLILKKHCSELVPAFEIVLACVAVAVVFDAVGRSGLEKLLSVYSQSGELFASMLKGAAVTVLTRLACDVCRESGSSLMADIVELGGRVMLIVLAVPYIEAVLETALSLYG